MGNYKTNEQIFEDTGVKITEDGRGHLEGVLGSIENKHCVKSFQIRSFFWSIFSCICTEWRNLFRKSLYSVRIHENTDHKRLRVWTPFTQ